MWAQIDGGGLIHDAANVIEELQKQLAAVTAERDAAIEDLKKDRHCLLCANHRENNGDCFGMAMCGTKHPDWKWRGMGESNGI